VTSQIHLLKGSFFSTFYLTFFNSLTFILLNFLLSSLLSKKLKLPIENIHGGPEFLHKGEYLCPDAHSFHSDIFHLPSTLSQSLEKIGILNEVLLCKFYFLVLCSFFLKVFLNRLYWT